MFIIDMVRFYKPCSQPQLSTRKPSIESNSIIFRVFRLQTIKTKVLLDSIYNPNGLFTSNHTHDYIPDDDDDDYVWEWNSTCDWNDIRIRFLHLHVHVIPLNILIKFSNKWKTQLIFLLALVFQVHTQYSDNIFQFHSLTWESYGKWSKEKKKKTSIFFHPFRLANAFQNDFDPNQWVSFTLSPHLRFYDNTQEIFVI